MQKPLDAAQLFLISSSKKKEAHSSSHVVLQFYDSVCIGNCICICICIYLCISINICMYMCICICTHLAQTHIGSLSERSKRRPASGATGEKTKSHDRHLGCTFYFILWELVGSLWTFHHSTYGARNFNPSFQFKWDFPLRMIRCSAYDRGVKFIWFNIESCPLFLFMRLFSFLGIFPTSFVHIAKLHV